MHNLSEKIIVFDPLMNPDTASLASRCIDIATAVADYTGWDRTDNVLYLDINHKYRIEINPDTTATNNRAFISAYFNGNVSLNGSRGDLGVIGFTSATSIRIHRSTNELSTYICFGNNAYNSFIYAINNVGESVLFRHALSGTTGYIFVGANSMTEPTTMPFQVSNGRTKYSVAKYVDFFSTVGGEFVELYWVYSSISPAVDNALVNFNGTIMRLITLSRNAAHEMFAIPVSEPASEENNEPEQSGE